MKKIYLLIIGTAVSLTACIGGGSGGSSGGGQNVINRSSMSCAVNANKSSNTKYTMLGYSESNPSLSSDPGPNILGAPASNLYNSLVFDYIQATSSENGSQTDAKVIVYSVSTKNIFNPSTFMQQYEPNMVNLVLASSGTFKSAFENLFPGQYPADACFVGVYGKFTDNDIAPAFLTNCKGGTPQYYESYVFSANYTIKGSGSIPETNGTLTFSCTTGGGTIFAK